MEQHDRRTGWKSWIPWIAVTLLAAWGIMMAADWWMLSQGNTPLFSRASSSETGVYCGVGYTVTDSRTSPLMDGLPGRRGVEVAVAGLPASMLYVLAAAPLLSTWLFRRRRPALSICAPLCSAVLACGFLWLLYGFPSAASGAVLQFLMILLCHFAVFEGWMICVWIRKILQGALARSR